MTASDARHETFGGNPRGSTDHWPGPFFVTRTCPMIEFPACPSSSIGISNVPSLSEAN